MSFAKGRVKVISPFHVLNCNLILRQQGRSSFGLFRRASIFNTSLSFTPCLNAQNLGIDSILSQDSRIYMIMLFFYIQNCLKFHLIPVLFLYWVALLKTSERPCKFLLNSGFSVWWWSGKYYQLKLKQKPAQSKQQSLLNRLSILIILDRVKNIMIISVLALLRDPISLLSLSFCHSLGGGCWAGLTSCRVYW